MTSLFKGRTYLLVLIACFLSLLAIFLAFYICNKYVSSRKKTRSKTSTSTLQSVVDGSVIKYDALRLVYNTTLEHQQNDFKSPTQSTDLGDVSSLYERDTDSVLKTINFVQPSPYTQRVGSRVGSRLVSECSEETEEEEQTNPIGQRKLSSQLRDVGLGKLSVSLFYNRSSSTFRVNVIQWMNSGSVSLKHAVSPYVKVSLLPAAAESEYIIIPSEDNAEENAANEPSTTDKPVDRTDVKTFLTKTKGKENPVFDEEFWYGVDSEEELEGMLLMLNVCDFDRFSRQVEVGCCEVKVGDFMEVAGMAEGSGELWLDVVEPKDEKEIDKGEILYSLQYFPTAGRITFTLVKAKRLNIEEDETSISIKVNLLFGRKIAKTHKFEHTGTTSDMRNPELNLSCSFEVPSEMFQYTNIRLCVYAYNAMKKRLIGKTPTGLEAGNQSGASVVAQWNEMVAQPRVAALYWHKLV